MWDKLMRSNEESEEIFEKTSRVATAMVRPGSIPLKWHENAKVSMINAKPQRH